VSLPADNDTKEIPTLLAGRMYRKARTDMDKLGINWVYLLAQIAICTTPLLLVVLILVIVKRRGNELRRAEHATEAKATDWRPRVSSTQAQNKTIKLGKSIQILVGLGTAWVTLYPFLFFAAWLAMFLGMDTTIPSPRENFSLFMEPFYIVFPLHLLTILFQFALVTFYLLHIIKNSAALETARILLGVGIFFLPFVAMPTYYYLYIWLDHPPAWALANGGRR